MGTVGFAIRGRFERYETTNYVGLDRKGRDKYLGQRFLLEVAVNSRLCQIWYSGLIEQVTINIPTAVMV